MTVDYEKLDELIVKSVAGSHGSPLNDVETKHTDWPSHTAARTSGISTDVYKPYAKAAALFT